MVRPRSASTHKPSLRPPRPARSPEGCPDRASAAACLRRGTALPPPPARAARGQRRVLPVGDHPADRVAAEDVEHDVEVEVRPLRRPQQLGDVPGPGLSAPWPPARAWRTGDAHVDCAALGPADSRPVSDTSCAPSTDSGLRRAASPPPPLAHGRRSVGRRAHRGRARARIRTAPGRALDGAAGARESTSDDGRRSPATPPALGTPTCAASGWAAISNAFRVRGSIPAARQLPKKLLRLPPPGEQTPSTSHAGACWQRRVGDTVPHSTRRPDRRTACHSAWCCRTTPPISEQSP